MLHAAKLPRNLWAESVLCAVLSLNMLTQIWHPQQARTTQNRTNTDSCPQIPGQFCCVKHGSWKNWPLFCCALGKAILLWSVMGMRVLISAPISFSESFNGCIGKLGSVSANSALMFLLSVCRTRQYILYVFAASSFVFKIDATEFWKFRRDDHEMFAHRPNSACYCYTNRCVLFDRFPLPLLPLVSMKVALCIFPTTQSSQNALLGHQNVIDTLVSWAVVSHICSQYVLTYNAIRALS